MQASRLKPHLQYLAYVLRHKYHVFWGCLQLGVPLWRALIHDWTKFTPIEWGPYVKRFYGPKPPVLGKTGYLHRIGDDMAFDRAWDHHWQNNPHHWQHWVKDDPAHNYHFPPEEMPETYVREMVADWKGAGLAQGKPDLKGWYQANKDKMILHPKTRQLVEALLEAM